MIRLAININTTERNESKGVEEQSACDVLGVYFSRPLCMHIYVYIECMVVVGVCCTVLMLIDWHESYSERVKIIFPTMLSHSFRTSYILRCTFYAENVNLTAHKVAHLHEMHFPRKHTASCKTITTPSEMRARAQRHFKSRKFHGTLMNVARLRCVRALYCEAYDSERRASAC